MDFYAKKSRWKWWLAIAGIVIVLISAIFTIYLTNKLAEEERKKIELFLIATEKIADESIELTDDELFFYLKIQQGNTTIPVMLVDLETDSIVFAVNFGESRDTDNAYLEKQLKLIKRGNNPPIQSSSQNMYYKKSYLLNLLQYFPIVQMLLIAAFIVVGYFSFSTARRGEQNRVWAGMAKETAHQLGTPISAMLGWIDHVKITHDEDEDLMEVMDELRNDVSRLELIADRFSKIGSAPELKPVNIYDELEAVKVYMQRRASRKISFNFPNPADQAPKTVQLNSHLFAWVVENLMRNALDAMGGKGSISADVYEDPKYVSIDLTDTGKGIPSSKFKTVFQPGFSTKKRGWGLGLSLAKRIIEEYHDGKIFVKDSQEGVGTTFTIRLPNH